MLTTLVAGIILYLFMQVGRVNLWSAYLRPVPPYGTGTVGTASPLYSYSTWYRYSYCSWLMPIFCSEMKRGTKAVSPSSPSDIHRPDEQIKISHIPFIAAELLSRTTVS